MRKNILLLFILSFCLGLIAQENIYIYKADKSIEEVAISDIEDITLDDSNQNINITKADNSILVYPKIEIDSITFADYSNTYDKYNQIVDIFDNAGNVFWVLDGGPRTHVGYLELAEDIEIEKTTHPKFGNGYKIKSENPFLTFTSTDNYTRIFKYIKASDIVGRNVNSYVIGFWLDRKELKGHPLELTTTSGGTWRLVQEDLETEGFVGTQLNVGPVDYKQIEVAKVDGDFSYIIIRYKGDSPSKKDLFNIIFEDNSNGVKELTFYNPTLLYEDEKIDPYHVYKSESQKNNSPLRGKSLLVLGDSQQNDAVMSLGIARKLGMNVYHNPMGGHRMKYQNAGSGEYKNWMYHWEARKRALAVEADYYFLMVSSNDSSGGGDISTSAMNTVLDSYPAYGDNETTINSKLSLFNALSESQKDAIFGYKQTYSAYINQINILNPNAKIILATIPISSYGVTEYDSYGNTVYKPGITADTQREERNWIFTSIRDDIYEISGKFNTKVCDLFNKGGITWENLPSKLEGEDSVHWKEDAKIEFIEPIIETLLEAAE